MEYFWLMQDTRLARAFSIKDFSNIPEYLDVIRGDLTVLEDMSVLNARFVKIEDCPDIFDERIFMVHGAVREVFEMFLPETEYRDICFLNPNTEEHIYYSVPLLSGVDCYSDKSEANPGRHAIRHLVLNKEKLPKEHMFKLSDVPETVVVVSLVAAEAILRRNPVGIRFIAVDLT